MNKSLTKEHQDLLDRADRVGLDTFGYGVPSARIDRLREKVETAEAESREGGGPESGPLGDDWDGTAEDGPRAKAMADAERCPERYQAEIPSDDPEHGLIRGARGPAPAPPSTAITRYVDKAMFEAEEVEPDALERPKVYLLSATPDPLGAVAAFSMMYEGRVVRDLAEITDAERRHYFEESFKTALRAPLEAIDLHFMIEGVTRAFTHQAVRQRTAVYAQESMRFAVKEKIAARPGPLIRADRKAYQQWRDAVGSIHAAYLALIAQGVPAEEARGLLPHDTLTRLHYKTNLRNLEAEVGKRLCTQAQFEWRLVHADLRRAIREYGALHLYRTADCPKSDGEGVGWQFELIADSPMFRPICFQTGKCMFKAQMDRGCTIRERVDRGAFEEIETAEWLADPTAGWSL